MTVLDPGKIQVWNRALDMLRLARELQRELLQICPDGQREPEAATANVAARAALRTAIDVIQHNPPTSTAAAILDGHWAGLMDGVCRIISAMEMEMYDPREHPERYK